MDYMKEMFHEGGLLVGRYPFHLLQKVGDTLTIHGRTIDVKFVQTAASLYAKRHGVKFATRSFDDRRQNKETGEAEGSLRVFILRQE